VKGSFFRCDISRAFIKIAAIKSFFEGVHELDLLLLHVFLVSIAYEVDVLPLLLVSLLVTVWGVEGLLFFKVIESTTLLVSGDIGDIGCCLEL